MLFKETTAAINTTWKELAAFDTTTNKFLVSLKQDVAAIDDAKSAHIQVSWGRL